MNSVTTGSTATKTTFARRVVRMAMALLGLGSATFFWYQSMWEAEHGSLYGVSTGSGFTAELLMLQGLLVLLIAHCGIVWDQTGVFRKDP